MKSYPKGRLLTPEEGCGYSKVQNTRIVGGAPAKNGAWPWYVFKYKGSKFGRKYCYFLLPYRLALLFCEDDEETWPNCGKSYISLSKIYLYEIVN